MLHEHLEQGIVRGQPLLHAPLEQGLLAQLEVLLVQGDTHRLEHLLHRLEVVVHRVLEHLGDRREAEHAKGALDALRRCLAARRLDPLLLLGVEKVVAPEALHHLVDVDVELLGVHARELGERERPPVQAGREGHRALGRVDLHVAQLLVVVGGREHVDVLAVLDERDVHVLRRELELEEGAVELVHRDHGLDALAKGLAQHRLGLDAHALDAVDDDERAVGDAKRGSDLRREVDVAGRVDEVDDELGAIGQRGQLVVLLRLEEERDAGRLDRDAALLLILAGVGRAHVAGRRGCDDAGGGQERVGQGRLAVIDVRDHRHVADVVGLALNLLQLFDGDCTGAWGGGASGACEGGARGRPAWESGAIRLAAACPRATAPLRRARGQRLQSVLSSPGHSRGLGHHGEPARACGRAPAAVAAMRRLVARAGVQLTMALEAARVN